MKFLFDLQDKYLALSLKKEVSLNAFTPYLKRVIHSRVHRVMSLKAHHTFVIRLTKTINDFCDLCANTLYFIWYLECGTSI